MNKIFLTDHIQAIATVVSALSAAASAIFAWLIFRLGQAQLKTIERQVDIAVKQAEIAIEHASINKKMAEQDAKLLTLTQRPRLIIDRIAFPGDSPNQFPPESLPSVLIDIVNIGGTSALIENSKCAFYFGRDGMPSHLLRTLPNEGNLLDAELGTVIDAGSSISSFFRGYKKGFDRLENQGVLSPQFAKKLNDMKSSTDFYVIGSVEYSDNVGSKREVRFARQWHGGTRRFEAVADDYYEREF